MQPKSMRRRGEESVETRGVEGALCQGRWQSGGRKGKRQVHKPRLWHPFYRAAYADGKAAAWARKRKVEEKVTE